LRGGPGSCDSSVCRKGEGKKGVRKGERDGRPVRSNLQASRKL